MSADTGGLASGECATPIRALLRGETNVRVAMWEAVALDAERRELTLDRGERIGYDSLIVSNGGETSYFGHEEWRESASVGVRRLRGRAEPRDRAGTPRARVRV